MTCDSVGQAVCWSNNAGVIESSSDDSQGESGDDSEDFGPLRLPSDPAVTVVITVSTMAAKLMEYGCPAEWTLDSTLQHALRSSVCTCDLRVSLICNGVCVLQD